MFVDPVIVNPDPDNTNDPVIAWVVVIDPVVINDPVLPFKDCVQLFMLAVYVLNEEVVTKELVSIVGIFKAQDAVTAWEADTAQLPVPNKLPVKDVAPTDPVTCKPDPLKINDPVIDWIVVIDPVVITEVGMVAVIPVS